jgi:hypothetical protein
MPGSRPWSLIDLRGGCSEPGTYKDTEVHRVRWSDLHLTENDDAASIVVVSLVDAFRPSLRQPSVFPLWTSVVKKGSNTQSPNMTSPKTRSCVDSGIVVFTTEDTEVHRVRWSDLHLTENDDAGSIVVVSLVDVFRPSLRQPSVFPLWTSVVKKLSSTQSPNMTSPKTR